MNEIKFANKIRQALNEGARLQGATGATIVERLRAARERAIEARRISPASELARARSTASGVVVGFGGFGGFSLRVVLPSVLLVAGLVSIYNWQQDQRAADLVELDAQLLTDDLPIDAYLDRGFEAWLKKVSSGNTPDDN
jgi:Protein of unknown function (DUF3619)